MTSSPVLGFWFFFIIIIPIAILSVLNLSSFLRAMRSCKLLHFEYVSNGALPSESYK